jgi:hypothetical protein
MTTQNNPLDYVKAIQAQLATIFSPVPVYQEFNRNWSSQPKFVTWSLRNVHQPVYTGTNQNVKGIDRPIFQISIFTKKSSEAWDLCNTLLQSLHGYSGQFGGVSGFYIAKADVDVLYKTYDNEIGLQQIILDCTLDIPA